MVGETWLAWTALGAGSLGLAIRVYWFVVQANRRGRINQTAAWIFGLLWATSTWALDPGNATRWADGLPLSVWLLLGLIVGSWLEHDIDRIRDGKYPAWATWRRDLRQDLEPGNGQRGFASGTIPAWQRTVGDASNIIR